MFWFILFLLLGIGLIALSKKAFIPKAVHGFGKDINMVMPLRVAGTIIILLAILSTSFVNIGSEEVGHLKKIWGTKNLPEGKIIATEGEKGLQSRILAPGIHFIPLINIIYDVEKLSIVTVPAGNLGVLVAKDGIPLREGQYIADEWPEQKKKDMLDATFFLTEGTGQKGPQLDVITPGKYRLNKYLFDISVHPATGIAAGEVGVIKSNVGATGPEVISDRVSEDMSLSVPLVKKGSVGVWDEPLYPGTYYLNPLAYEVTKISTRMFSWVYKGGYIKRDITLTVDEKGQIKQQEEKFEVMVPQEAADAAMLVQSKDNWRFPVEFRVQGQVEPEDAPLLVAFVGGISEAEDKVVTPVMRAEARNKAESIPASDYIGRRSETESSLEEKVIPEAKKAGVTIIDIRMGDPLIPAELRIAVARKDLAEKLQVTYRQERKAQTERISAERARAEADQQPELIKAEIAKQASVLYMKTQQNRGQADANYLKRVAEGQSAQAKVLGKDNVYNLELTRLLLLNAKEAPQIVKMPEVVVLGGATGTAGMEGAAAVLGWSNITSAMKSPGTIVMPPTPPARAGAPEKQGP